MEVFGVMECRFHRDGKGMQEIDKTLRKGLGSWWRDAHIHRSKSVSMQVKCRRVVSNMFSTVLNGSANWSWNADTSLKVHQWETKILRLTIQTEADPRWRAGRIQTEDVSYDENKMERNGPDVIG